MDSKDWNPYITRLFHILYEIRGDSLRDIIRPHSAKIWQGITDEGSGKEVDITVYLKEVTYKESIAEFKTQLDVLGRDAGLQEECRQVFMDFMIWVVGIAPP